MATSLDSPARTAPTRHQALEQERISEQEWREKEQERREDEQKDEDEQRSANLADCSHRRRLSANGVVHGARGLGACYSSTAAGRHQP